MKTLLEKIQEHTKIARNSMQRHDDYLAECMEIMAEHIDKHLENAREEGKEG